MPNTTISLEDAARVVLDTELGMMACTGSHAPAENALGLLRDALAATAPNAGAPLEEMSPEFTDTARAALLWVLWHHQGGSSTVGQPIRFALGMGQHEHLNDHQIAEAKRWAALAAAPAQQAGAPASSALQPRVMPWLLACFGEKIAADREERNHRFLEESLELVQACGCTAGEAHQLVDYVFGRPVGEKDQEVGGVMITLAALCLANGLDMHEAGERELARIWTMVEKIRAKQAAKPKHSPLPEAASNAAAPAEGTQQAGAPLPLAPSARIVLDFKMAVELLGMFGGEPGTITLLPGNGHSGKGLYPYIKDMPEEGAEFLGVPDDEAKPTSTSTLLAAARVLAGLNPDPLAAQPQADAAEPVAREDFYKMSADLTRAKYLLVRLYDQIWRDPSPEKLRGMIEGATGSWFIWGEDREAATQAPSAAKKEGQP